MSGPAAAWRAARNVLAVRLDNLGDVLMTTPALAALRAGLAPGARLTLLGSPAGAAAARWLPMLDDAIGVDAPWVKASAAHDDDDAPLGAAEARLVARLAERRFDAAVIFTVCTQSALPAALLCRIAGIGRRLAHSRENPYALLTDWVRDTEVVGDGMRHEVERQLALVAAVGFAPAGERLRLRFDAADVRRLHATLRADGIDPARPYVVVHPGASAASRRWPAERFGAAAQAIADDSGCAVLFTGGADEAALVEAARAAMRAPSRSLAGRLDLGQLAALLAGARLLVANNSGPVHVAAAVGTPVVDLYALTNPQHTPWRTPSRVLSHDVPCRNCLTSVCPSGHHQCLRGVPADAVAGASRELMAAPPPALPLRGGAAFAVQGERAMTATLGINAVFHDSAAALVVDGEVVAAAEEERFTRIKHAKRPLPFSAWELPFHAIDDCLRQAGLTLDQVDHVAYSFEPRQFAGDRAALDGQTLALPLQPSVADHGDWDSPWDPLFIAYVVNAPRLLRDAAPHHLRKRLRAGPPQWQWHYVGHHLCHQASAFLAAPFERCAVMTLDGRGEQATTSYGVWRDGRYAALGEVTMPHSLGLLYERVTAHLGFLHSSDEYKVMALAALGQPTLLERLAECVPLLGDGRYRIKPFDLAALAGPPRVPGTPLQPQHFDLAASLQALLEQRVLQLAQWLREASAERRLAMAGGVALNCLMNARLRDDGPFDEVWVQPAAGDAGTALGAALWVDAQQRASAPPTLAPRRWRMTEATLGPAYADDEIEPLLRWAKLPYGRLDGDAALADAVAERLADDRIVGWFQGRMEFGPRALGARSILASPISPQMQARLNELKDREDFRPVAPVLPRERLADWFAPADANGGESPFMLFVYDAVQGRAERIPSACHTDGTARVQTVERQANPRLHALLTAFEARTGVPVLVNTSFNVRGEPIVCTPKDALSAFWSTPLDALAIGSFLVDKPR